MKQGLGWLSCALLIAAVIAGWMPAQARQDQVPATAELMQVLEGTGASGLEGQARLRVSLGKVKSPEEWQRQAETWASRLGISQPDAAIEKSSSLLSYRVKTSRGGVQIHYGVTGVSNNGWYDPYLVIQLIGSPQSLRDVDNLREKFAKVLEEAGWNPQFSTCVRGIYNDKMSVDRQTERILSIFRIFHAKELERMQDETVVSISGYSQLWEGFIPLRGGRMNLQAATHRSSGHGTFITIGTPIITAEY